MRRGRIATVLLTAAGVLAVAAVLGANRVSAWQVWAAAGRALHEHPVVRGAIAGSVLLAAAGVVLLRRHEPGVQRGNDSPRRAGSRWAWLLTDRGVATTVAATVGLGVVALLWMLTVASAAPAGKDQATLRIEAIKYGLGAIAASGAIAALLLAVRRQRLAEETQALAERAHELARQAQTHTELDARARRVTDLYTKAVEQVGSADAAVRLGGLYALERVAQDNPDQRQTIVNVVCAYLRMPYIPPQPMSTTNPKDHNEAAPDPDTPEPLPVAAPPVRDPEQEQQVRLTAQRILATHLIAPTGTDPEQAQHVPAHPDQAFWPGIDLDLTGATLLDWQLHRGSLQGATFHRSRFIGRADFGGAAFAGAAGFGEATFTGDAWFGGATFAGATGFGEATFTGDAWFGGATFAGATGFGEATFTGDAWFGGATFGDAWFDGATFGDAGFGKATFTGDAGFGGATFAGAAGFGEATFTGDARFGGATFKRAAWFGGATFKRAAWFGGATFKRAAWFGGAAFTGDAGFGGATFAGDAWFGEATFAGAAGFGGATFGDAWFGKATFTGAAGFGKATFGDAWFGKATFTGAAGFGGATFKRNAGFGEATFTGDARFEKATFTGDARFDETQVILRPGRNDVWPAGLSMRPSLTNPTALGLLTMSIAAAAADPGPEPAGQPGG
ncbi:pentapeptide repeat-containing protein [Dactylosporangium sp. McL0621]|uniref:pentapeptide repeat-containing protein n=1 Tax=Dactylosporangium sp. McL0621 TaxID=3415678 RepID=UPI003CE9028C